MERGVGFGLGATPWTSEEPHAHVRRATGFLAWGQTESGHGCPISMTYAAVPALRVDDALDVLRALRREPEVLDAWITEVGRAQGTDPRLDRAITTTLETLADSVAVESQARRLAVRMALCLQAAGLSLLPIVERATPTP